MPPRVILIGPPGAGKSSVGKSLSRLLKEDFIDTDTVIAEQEKQSIGEIFVDKGEPYFREVEEQVLLKQLVEHSGVTLAGAAPRVGFNRDRPLLLGNPRAQWQELMNVRRPIYESLAHHQLMTDKLTPNEAATAIVTLLS